MKTTARIIALAALAWSGAASADGYFGVTAGLMDVDVSGDSPFNAGIRGGFQSPAGWGVEGEATTSLSDGEFDTGFGSIDYSLDTVAAYGTYRTQGDTYFKARAGVLYENVDAGFADGNDTGASAGLGVGFALGGNGSVELEYTFIESDVNYWSGSFIFRF